MQHQGNRILSTAWGKLWKMLFIQKGVAVCTHHMQTAQILKLLPRLQRLTESGTRELAMLQGSSDGRRKKRFYDRRYKPWGFPIWSDSSALWQSTFPIFSRRVFTASDEKWKNWGCGTNASRTSLGSAIGTLKGWCWRPENLLHVSKLRKYRSLNWCWSKITRIS